MIFHQLPHQIPVGNVLEMRATVQSARIRQLPDNSEDVFIKILMRILIDLD